MSSTVPLHRRLSAVLVLPGELTPITVKAEMSFQRAHDHYRLTSFDREKLHVIILLAFASWLAFVPPCILQPETYEGVFFRNLPCSETAI